MQLAQPKPFMQRHMAWLLWLALLLPLAQTAASWHILSHANSEQTKAADDQQAVHQAHCELCLSAAALIGGAPLASLPNLFHPRAMAEVLAADVRGVISTPTARAYESRAPPFLQH
jgi:hypothetical protein